MGGCNVAGDCPGGTCNTTTHTCQALPDAGMPTDGGVGGDASPPADGGSLGDGSSSPDGAVSPGMDAGAQAPDAAETSGAYLDGGGLSCGIASTGRGSGPVVPAALAAMGLLAAARRRRSR
jgi:MYXO-CTERM domain-containing protein